MAAIRPEMAEFECCPQCAGRFLEALEAAGMAREPDDEADEGSVQPASGSRMPNG